MGTINLIAILSELGPEFEASAARLDETDSFVAANYDALRARRVFSALVPEAYGGGGASHRQMCAFLRGLAHRCPSTALALSMHQHLVAAAVANDRAGRPGRALLERVVATEAVLVSTGANDWLKSTGTARAVEGGYRITAAKPFASGSPKGDLLITSAVYDDPAYGEQVLHFPVPFAAEGVSLADDWHTMTMRATGSHTVRLESVFVPETAVVGCAGGGGVFHNAFAVILTVAMPLIMSVYVGVAEAAAAIARAQAARRPEDPVMPVLVGEMETLLAAAQIATDDMIRLANDFDFTPSAALASQVLIRKTLAASHAIATAEKALAVVGGAGLYRKLGLERLLRDAHGALFHPLPERHQQLFTGRVALGLDPVAAPATEPLRHAA